MSVVSYDVEKNSHNFRIFMKLFNILLASLLFSGSVQAQFGNFLKDIKGAADALQKQTTNQVSPAPDQSDLPSIFKTFGLTGPWSTNCQNLNSIIEYQNENNKVVMRYKNPDATTYAIIENAKLLDDKKLQYSSQIYSTKDNQPLRKINGVLQKNEDKITIFFLELVIDGKSEILTKDGINTKDNSKPSPSSNCTGIQITQQTKSDPNSNQSNGTNTAKKFREIWCKSPNSSISGPVEFKGIRTGDLCLAPDDLIIAIEASLKKSRLPFEWISQPKVLDLAGTLMAENVVAGDKGFFAIAINIDPLSEKAYLASYSGLICAADSTNSLNADNPFRKALESKYGKPASAYSAYDQLKEQIDALENQNSAAKNQAITIREAKNTRDVDNQLPMLKKMLAVSDKKEILLLEWAFEKGNPQRSATAQIQQAAWNKIRDVGKGCDVTYEVKGRSGQDYGFAFQVGNDKQMQLIEASINSRTQAKEKAKVLNAPAPKF